MDVISKLPDKKGVIGAREIEKAVKHGRVKHVVIANNCPQALVEKVHGKHEIRIDRFEGDQSQLGTKLGKPFPVAMVGYE